ncbi:Transmembrane emp24 domain-containing protein p24beta2 [Hibiscus syriacus]|uniref:Transmembrane emp24 domain-containing protein p24beta2 n=1 Tax=Hibiscus syriacus TaxID=106335 RepID=A0A6A2ZNE2_HIBSY|nr:Transmembrane emp24 domain-containing protein p24beta2 [Hibiscus syriacus]
MKIRFLEFVAVILLALSCGLNAVCGIRFTIDREECLSHDIKYEGDTIHASFVVIKADSGWHSSHEGVDLVTRTRNRFPVSLFEKPSAAKAIRLFLSQNSRVVLLGTQIHDSRSLIQFDTCCNYQVKGPLGDQIQDYRDKISEKFEFVANKKGVHHFCFSNRSPYHETVDFDVHESHFSYFDQHAKDEHFDPLIQQISKLEEALHNIQFEQHWLEAQTERQAIVNEAMSKKALHKALYESAALIGASVASLPTPTPI